MAPAVAWAKLEEMEHAFESLSNANGARGRVARGTATLLFLQATLALGSGCVVVQPHERAHLMDPSMQLVEAPLEDRALQKLHIAREGAVGADGPISAGGCACGN